MKRLIVGITLAISAWVCAGIYLILAAQAFALAWVESYNGTYAMIEPHRRWRMRATADVLQWLLHFPGGTWDERWFASGLDEAPRDGLAEVSRRLSRPASQISLGVTSLVRGRLVRPSYEWMFTSKQWNRSAATFPSTGLRTSSSEGTPKTPSPGCLCGPEKDWDSSRERTSSPIHTPLG